MKPRKSLIKILLICISFAVSSSLVTGQGYSRFDVTTLNGNSVYSYNQVPDALVPYNATSPGTFQWERSYSPVNGFEVITDATLSTYTFSAPLQQTTYFRRRTTISGLLIYYSNVVKSWQLFFNANDNLYQKLIW